MIEDLEKFQQEHGTYHEEAANLVPTFADYTIESEQDRIMLGEARSELKEKARAVEVERKKIADPLHKAWKATNTFFKKYSKPLDECVRILDLKMKDWDREQARLKIERQREAEEAARRALEARNEGKQEAAAEAFEEAQAAIIESAKPIPQAEGQKKISNWKARISDLPALVAHVIKAGHWDMISIDLSRLHALAKATRVEGPAKDWPGVEFFDDFYYKG